MKMKICTLILCAALTSCGKIYHYELDEIADDCGGYDQIKSMWLDATTVRAYCKDGSLANTKD